MMCCLTPSVAVACNILAALLGLPVLLLLILALGDWWPRDEQ